MKETKLTRNQAIGLIIAGAILIAFCIFLGRALVIAGSDYTALSTELASVKEELDATKKELADLQASKSSAEEDTEEDAALANPAEIIGSLSDCDFDTAFQILSSPDTHEAVLYIMATRLQYFAGSRDEYLQLLTAILSAPNANVSIVTALTVDPDVYGLPLIAASSLHDEVSLYLLVAQLKSYSTVTGSGEAYSCLVSAAMECIRNPKITKASLDELSEIGWPELKPVIAERLKELS